MASIVEIAVANLKEATRLEINWKVRGTNIGLLTIRIENKRIELHTVVKNHIRMQQIHEILSKYNPELIIANKIYEKEKEFLRERGIGFLEENGNIELKRAGLYLLIDKSRSKEKTIEKGNRAFTKTGLKIIFQLLQDKDLVNQPQREIAIETGVALGNIPLVLKGLQSTNYLIKKNQKEYLWNNREELLNRWIEAYETILKPQLYIGTFKLNENWQTLSLNQSKTVWGGEPAADILTNYLRPEKFTLYTEETKNELIKNYRILPNEKGEIKAYKFFWIQNKNLNITPPLLVYVDLLIEGGKRNIETAEKIYNEYIKPNL
jgi:hypothetical protein